MEESPPVRVNPSNQNKIMEIDIFQVFVKLRLGYSSPVSPSQNEQKLKLKTTSN